MLDSTMMTPFKYTHFAIAALSYFQVTQALSTFDDAALQNYLTNDRAGLARLNSPYGYLKLVEYSN